MDLFDQNREKLSHKNAPLADRMRPLTLDEFIGQEHIIGPGRLLRRAIQIDQLSSIIFYGPPGTGKTTLARIIANTTKAQFISINAVLAGVKDIRDAIGNAQNMLSLYSKRTILFIDEVHRFNKAQQDALLPHVENGIIILIGATTENPYFEVNKALVSRSRIFQLNTLSEDDLIKVANQAPSDPLKGYGKKNVKVHADAMKHLVKVANGDARAVLNALELAVETTVCQRNNIISVTRSVIEDSIQQRAVLYDKDGDAHYDTISAFIKSVRGSDPDAALYWMAKMLYAGEDPRFIFRRMIILASEDVGLADPEALRVVIAAAQAFDYIGMPEGRFPMAQACLYLSTAPKSNSTLSFFDALNTVSKEQEDEVPNHLKDASRDKKGFGHGDGYLYPHAYRDHWVAQQYLPNILQGKTFYNPSDQGYEKRIKVDVSRRKEALIEAMVEPHDSDLYGASKNNASSNIGMWEQRTSGTSGTQLGLIRDQIIKLANLEKQSIVLDLNCNTGLLTFEAIRHVPEGCVWALTHDKKAYETMQTMAQRFPPFSQPQIIQTHFETCDKDICKETGKDVEFDAIIGRNVLIHLKDKISFVKRLQKHLKINKKIILAETVHHSSLRISDIVKFSKSQFKEKFRAAEDKLFSDPKNAMVNWTVDSLRDNLKKLGVFERDFSEITYSPLRRITNTEIDFWLRKSDKKERSSLGDYLRKSFSDKDFDKVRNLLYRQLDNVEVTWKSVLVFIALTKRDVE